MTRTPSTMLGLGTGAPDFRLPDAAAGGKDVALADFEAAPALLVAFICNHCPFVLHILDDFVAFARDYQPRGLGIVAISSNDPAEHPEDAPELMAALAREKGFSFPYLFDEAQTVAIAYNAICTPDFFLFDGDRKLFYAGQFDASRPQINRPPMPGMPPLRTDLPVTGEDLRAAADAVLAGAPPPQPQRASAGCSIKWKPENEPEWA